MTQAYLQFVGDLLMITGLVYYFGGVASPFSMLYLIVISVAAVDAAPPRRHPAWRPSPTASMPACCWRSTAIGCRCPSRLASRTPLGLATDLQPGHPSLRLLRRRPAHLLPGAERSPRREASSKRSARTSPISQIVHRDVIAIDHQRPDHHRPPRHGHQRQSRRRGDSRHRRRPADRPAGRAHRPVSRGRLAGLRPSLRAPRPGARRDRVPPQRGRALRRLLGLAPRRRRRQAPRLHRRLPGSHRGAQAAGGSAAQGRHGGGG